MGPNLAALAELTDETFRKMFSKSSIKRIGRDRFLRNVMIAIGNSGDAKLLSSVTPRLKDSSYLVREAAGWALEELSNSSLQ